MPRECVHEHTHLHNNDNREESKRKTSSTPLASIHTHVRQVAQHRHVHMYTACICTHGVERGEAIDSPGRLCLRNMEEGPAGFSLGETCGAVDTWVWRGVEWRLVGHERG